MFIFISIHSNFQRKISNVFFLSLRRRIRKRRRRRSRRKRWKDFFYQFAVLVSFVSWDCFVSGVRIPCLHLIPSFVPVQRQRRKKRTAPNMRSDRPFASTKKKNLIKNDDFEIAKRTLKTKRSKLNATIEKENLQRIDKITHNTQYYT